MSWDFPTSRGGRELHPYPARFIPEIPAQALDLLEIDGPVLDPFCGSGTTLAEARKRGLPSTGIDLNPIACLISRVRGQRWSRGDSERALEHSNALRDRAMRGAATSELAARIPRIDHWFEQPAQEALAAAVEYLAGVEEAWRDRIAVAISSSVVRLSRQESDTRYAAIDKGVTRAQAATELGQAVVRVSEWIAANTTGYADVPVEVLCQDACDLSSLPPRHFAASVFSPPYPNAYEYWLYHKYRMYWLGFDPILVRALELGARPHYCKPNGLTEDDFAEQMSEVFRGLHHCLLPGAPVVVVVGDSVIGGRRIDNAGLMRKAAGGQGFSLDAHAERSIRGGRSSFNRAHTRARSSEHILLLRAP
ncbi:MAG TPA: hypothetical protein VFM94_09455 [Solirubrobacterales bacterium]|nr:hypothetical protein [Solirubrobacterales bacterium]